MIPKIALAVGVFVFLMGSGCAPSKISTDPKSSEAPINVAALGYIPTPSVLSVQEPPEGWNVQPFGGRWSLAHPGTVQPVNEDPAVKTRTRLFTIDLGTAVADAGDKTVPRRTLVLDELRPGDPHLTLGCVASSTELGVDRFAISTTTKQGRAICLRAQTEAAAGNRYDMAIATIVGVQSAHAIEYRVHSVACENFDQPSKRCVPYDEVRDMALFWRILDTLQPVR